MNFEVIWQFDVVHNAVQSAECGGEYVWGMYGGEANKTCNPNILFPHLIMQHNTPGTPDQQHNTPCVMLIYDHQGPTPLWQRERIHVNHMREAIRTTHHSTTSFF